MSFEINYSKKFKKELKRLRKRYSSILEDVNSLALQLSDNPFQGVDLGNGLRKIRLAITSKGKGKSGGARVISYNILVGEQDGHVLLLMIYDKSDRESLSDKELNDLVAAYKE